MSTQPDDAKIVNGNLVNKIDPSEARVLAYRLINDLQAAIARGDVALVALNGQACRAEDYGGDPGDAGRLEIVYRILRPTPSLNGEHVGYVRHND